MYTIAATDSELWFSNCTKGNILNIFHLLVTFWYCGQLIAIILNCLGSNVLNCNLGLQGFIVVGLH